ncbi:MAG: MoaD/ThiS family protein [Rhodanobacteraceae bacterium]|nr:MoaD/ThiS family protein [Pseudomonadota bacterium]
MNYQLLYFASLRDAAGRVEETVASQARDPRTLYTELAARYGFNPTNTHLRVAVNSAFAMWDHALADGDEVAFLPPVSGG